MNKFVKGKVLVTLCLVLAVITLMGIKSTSGAPLRSWKTFEVESIDKGKKTTLAELSQGKPFYLVFSTPT